MYIHEAVARALAEGKCIRRANPEIWRKARIEPTNSWDCCILYNFQQNRAPHWNPSAEDLMADDWIVIGEA